MFPHCDIHLALNNPAANSVDFRVFEYHGANSPFTLVPITNTVTPMFLAPHNAVGSRLHNFVNINVNTGTITATGLGTNLVVLQTADTYIVIRIQVHDNILAWWFGNEKITTAVDAAHAHSQPSIYAMFSDDATGTDRVGDITGHGFVTLTSADPTVFTVANTNNEGRMQGVAEGHANLNGSFLGINHTLPVEVIDYAKTRDILVPVRAGNLANAADLHNILFLAEGFTAADQAKFDQIVTQATAELFTKPRHEPFGTLSPSFNVFKAFTPSNDRLVTCGFQVTDHQVASLGKGTPIPYKYSVTEGMYQISELVARVGLPMRGESRNEAQLKALWGSQSLDNFNPAKIDGPLVEAWKNSHSLGYLEARDTFFGMILGSRWADQSSTQSQPLAAPPNDDGGDALKALVKRAYEFYKVKMPARSVTMDTRRHPPELVLNGQDNRAASFMTFVGGLRVKDPPHQPLGNGWVPDGTFKRSRGLIAMILNENMLGGTNLNDNTVTAMTLNSDLALTANYAADANASIKRLRREVPADIPQQLPWIINTIAHEFGHSFNLGDEYEEFVEYPTFANDFLNPADASPNIFDNFDNVASLETIFNDPQYLNNNSRKIDPNKLKWRDFPRIKLGARLTAASQINNGKLEVVIDPRETAAWEASRVAGEEVRLRRIKIEPDGRQLPLSAAANDHVTGLSIDRVDTNSGLIVLSGATPPSFPAGSSLYVPHKTQGGSVKTIIEDKVFAELNSSKDPLNKDTDTASVNRNADFPRDIDDFKPPCQSARLIGVFEGAGTWTGLVYRPTGTCKMRTSAGGEENGEFCYICKWLITLRVDPGKHHEIDRKFYPVAKKNE